MSDAAFDEDRINERLQGNGPIDPIAAMVAEFNAKYMVVNEAGKVIVYAPGFDQALRRHYYARMCFEDLRKLYLNRQIEVGTRQVKVGEEMQDVPILKKIADVWLSHSKRHQYVDGVVFDPSNKSTGNVLNLWKGFAVESRKGDWSKLRSHIWKVICQGNDDHYIYLCQWMARMVQFPAQQGEVAVVLKGSEGTGKGTLARALLYLTGQHGFGISNAKHLVGNFNLHLRDCVFLFADEAFFAGDKQHIGVLKSLITESILTIEGKNMHVVQAPNYLHILMATNEEWAVPASLEARRFFVLNVPDDHRNDHKYFGAIWEQMENGGYEAMLYDLLNMDISKFNVRAVPDTEGLRQQKQLSLGTSEAWWFDVLHRGYVYKSKLGIEAYFSQWREEVTTELLYASYEEFAKSRNERHPMDRGWFGRFMTKMGGEKIKFSHSAVTGEHRTGVDKADGAQMQQTELCYGHRPPGYHLGKLSDAQAAAVLVTGLTQTWEAYCDI